MRREALRTLAALKAAGEVGEIEGEHGTAARDDVELAATDADVAAEQAPAGAGEMVGRGLFGRAAESLPGVHGPTVARVALASYGADARCRVTLANVHRQGDGWSPSRLSPSCR